MTVAVSPLPTMLLIHGAWQGAWAWDAVLPGLGALGWRVQAVDLPGNGRDATAPEDVSLALYAAYVAGQLEKLPGPAVVVGHSGGGIVASQVAELVPERVTRLVFLAGMMLPSGASYADLVAELARTDPAAPGIAPHLVWSADRLTSAVTQAVARRFFYQDCDPADAAAAAGQLTPQPEHGRAIRPDLSARSAAIPRCYIETLRDASVLPALQRRMQQLSPGAVRLAIDSGHAPQLGHPAELVALLDRAGRG